MKSLEQRIVEKHGLTAEQGVVVGLLSSALLVDYPDLFLVMSLKHKLTTDSPEVKAATEMVELINAESEANMRELVKLLFDR